MKTRIMQSIAVVLIAIMLFTSILIGVNVIAFNTAEQVTLLRSGAVIADNMQLAASASLPSGLITITRQEFRPSILTATTGSAITWYNATTQTIVLKQGQVQRVFLPVVRAAVAQNELPSASLSAAESTNVPDQGAALHTQEPLLGTVEPGKTLIYTFTQPGRVDYFAGTNPLLTGAIFVQVGSPTTTPTSTLPITSTVTPTSTPHFTPTVTPVVTPSPAEVKAYQHLGEVTDKYHQTFDVYTDSGAGGNHFVHRARIGGGVSISDGFTEVVHSGVTAIKNEFTPSNSAPWGGWYFMVGMLEGNELIPKDNWGIYPNAGYDLTGATQLTFWARGASGGEQVEFFAFNVGRDEKGKQTMPYPDSEAKVTRCGRLSSPCYTTLTDIWQPYTITLTGLDLHYVLGGFGWATTAANNNNQAITFYLDDIRYDKPRLADPRFLLSFETIASGQPFDLVMRNVSFVYDDALALMNFVMAGDWERAQVVADAFVYAQHHDRYFYGQRYDGRLRNTYQAGDLTTPPGWAPNGITNTARLPGWWDAAQGKWLEDRKFVGTDTGNMAWVILALLTYYEERGGDQYLNAARDLGNWIAEHTVDNRGAGGFTGGYVGHESEQEQMPWKSTEHNLDLIAAFERLYQSTGDRKWHEHARHARKFVEAMWNNAAAPLRVQRYNVGCNNKPIEWTQDQSGGFFWTGTLLDGITPNKQAVPLDTQTWALMVLGRNPWTERAVNYGEINHAVTYTLTEQIQYAGFDFNEDRDLPWMEGTGQMVVAYDILGETAKAQHYLQEMREIQDTAPNNNQLGIVASPVDGLTNGFDWCYFNRLHVGATAWFIMAEQGYNPYWHRATPPNVAPYSVRIQGPITGTVDANYTFTGTVVAITLTTPITYTWQPTDQAPRTSVGNANATQTFVWNTSGVKQIILTAQSATSTGTYTHMIDIQTKTPPVPAYRLHGLDFGPYVANDQDPSQGAIVTEEQLRSLMTTVAPFTEWIRTYGCGSGLEHAGRIAHELKLKVAMGAWLSRNATANERQLTCLIARAKAGEVDLAIVGSEALFRNDLTAAQLLTYIQRVKTALPGIPVTTADVYARIVDNPNLVNAVDLVLVNLYPYWEGVNLDHAAALIHRRYQHVKAVAAGKQVIISETGWPSCGEQKGQAVASPANAAHYFLNFVSWARANSVPYFYFATFDEPWKAIYEGPQGACWGIWDKNSVLKSGGQAVFDGKTLPDNWSSTVIPGGPGKPVIEFTYVPPYGNFDNLQGQVWHVAPGDHSIVIFIRVGGQWWIKPYSCQPLTIIYPDGSWVADITTGGIDERAEQIRAYLILTENWSADRLANCQPLSLAEVENIAQASVEITRTPIE